METSRRRLKGIGQGGSQGNVTPAAADRSTHQPQQTGGRAHRQHYFHSTCCGAAHAQSPATAGPDTSSAALSHGALLHRTFIQLPTPHGPRMPQLPSSRTGLCLVVAAAGAAAHSYGLLGVAWALHWRPPRGTAAATTAVEWAGWTRWVPACCGGCSTHGHGCTYKSCWSWRRWAGRKSGTTSVVAAAGAAARQLCICPRRKGSTASTVA